jgi:N-methylhydantoinase A/oxoprolinase/acetone carboxylase beta subunit
MYINVDNGGTFTDFWAFDESRRFRAKTRTTPHDLSECLFEGLRLLAEDIFRAPDLRRLLAETRYIRYSTTQGTNALVQRKGPRIGLVLPLADDPEMMRAGDGVANMYDSLVGDRIERIDPRLLSNPHTDGGGRPVDAVMNAVNALTARGANRIVVSLGAREEHEFQRLAALRFPQHLLGTVPLLLATDVTADRNRVRATWTAILNAFLHPAMERFLFNTDNRLKALHLRAPLLVFRNDGLSGRVAKTSAIKTYGSGPEGGIRGAEALAQNYGYKHFVTLDVGGTTTDFGVVENGRAARISYGRLGAVEVSIPMSDLRSVGVGGGSIIRVQNGTIAVGPESAGAAPGPACFGFGGTQATITDVKLLKGVIDPNHYFGGRMTLDLARARSAIETNVAAPLGLGVDEAADAMEGAWVEAVGKHLRQYLKDGSVLGAFGGAGPFSICAIADAVGVKRVIVPALAAVFSASGIGESDIGHRYEIAVSGRTDRQEASRRIDALLARARQDMFAEGFELSSCQQSWSLRDKNGVANTIPAEALIDRLAASADGAEIMVELVVTHPVTHNRRPVRSSAASATASNSLTRTARLSGPTSLSLPVFLMEDLGPGATGKGPAIIEDDYFTLPVLDGWSFTITAQGDIELSRR